MSTRLWTMANGFFVLYEAAATNWSWNIHHYEGSVFHAGCFGIQLGILIVRVFI